MADSGLLDIAIFVVATTLISLYGTIRAAWESWKDERNAADELVGKNVSIFWVSLTVGATYASAISLLGFPAEIYYRGTMMFYYFLIYFVAYPVAAYVFLPVFYNLKSKSIYEYLERRFSVTCRIIASSTFALQTLLYESTALYAPASALANFFKIKDIYAIVITASLSAIYLFVGGARAGMFTASLQMILIFAALLFITVMPFFEWNISELFENAQHGGRLIFDDFRLDPTVRHSVFAFLLGGLGNILCLFATNQLTLQRYICLPTLRSAQKSILLVIPMHAFLLVCYITMGLTIYGIYHGCHPDTTTQNDILPYFIKDKLNYIPGIQGILLATLYSAGVSTLTASYNALTAVLIEDVIKLSLSQRSSLRQVGKELEWKLAKFLPIFFAACATLLAYLITLFKSIIIQIAFQIFGGLGGTTLGTFCIGIFCPWIKSSISAICGQIASVAMAIAIMSGTFANHITPVDLPLDSTCPAYGVQNLTLFVDPNRVNTVTSTNNYFALWTAISKISYQYYSVVGVLVCLIVSHIAELIIYLLQSNKERERVDEALLFKYVRFTQSKQRVLDRSMQQLNKFGVSSKL